MIELLISRKKLPENRVDEAVQIIQEDSCTGAVADYYLHQKTEIQYEVLCKCIGKVWKEGLKKYAK